MKTKLILAVLASWLLATACGDLSEDNMGEPSSEVASLVGIPCQAYGANSSNNDQFVCTKVNLGTNSVEVLYRLDGFNGPQRAKLKTALLLAMQRYSDYWIRPEGAPLLKCALRTTNQSLDPKGSVFSPSMKGSEQKVIWALTALQFGFQFHVDNRLPLVISGYDTFLDGEGSAPFARAQIGNDSLPTNSNMNFEVNRVALDQGAASKFDYSENSLAGAIFHEMLHRKGYEHKAEGRSVGPLVYELGNCIANLNNGFPALTGSGKRLTRVD